MILVLVYLLLFLLRMTLGKGASCSLPMYTRYTIPIRVPPFEITLQQNSFSRSLTSGITMAKKVCIFGPMASRSYYTDVDRKTRILFVQIFNTITNFLSLKILNSKPLNLVFWSSRFLFSKVYSRKRRWAAKTANTSIFRTGFCNQNQAARCWDCNPMSSHTAPEILTQLNA